MTSEQKRKIVNDFSTLTIVALENEIAKQALTLEGFIERQALNGVTASQIKANLLNDLRNDGAMFRSFKSAFKAQMFLGMEQAEDSAVRVSTGLREDTPSEWIAIADQNTCDDCLARANEGVRPYSYWQAIGLPATGTTICGNLCRCDVVPAGVFTTEMKDNARARYYKIKYDESHAGEISFKDAMKKVKGNLNE